MHCPDCGEDLREVSLLGGDRSFRCFKCGGFWVEGAVVNGIDSQLMEKWHMPRQNGEWMGLGLGGCPVDGTGLVVWRSEMVPSNIVVKRCERCGRWWFPSDNLLNFKPAQEAKIDYFKQWGVNINKQTFWLPVAVLIALLAGLIVSLQLVKVREQVAVPAFQLK